MSEKIYALLLRLYPSHFREAYGDEALQLFRDRARDEKGLVAGVRLWLDLLADLALSVPGEYFHAQPALSAASAHRRAAGIPSFFVFEDEPHRPGAMLFGGVLTLAALGAISVLNGQGGRYRPLSGWAAQAQRANGGRASGFGHAGRQLAGDSVGRTLASRGETEGGQPQAQDASGAMIPGVEEGAKLDTAERQRVIHEAAANLKEHYVYPDVGQKMADALLAHEKSGDDDAATDGEAFANLLTKQMRDVSSDRRVVLVYSKDPLPPQPTGPTAEDLARYKETMEKENCTFEKIEIRPRNIGYLKVNSFPDPSVCRGKATAAMESVNHAEAVIFDLRDNRGGEPEMVALMAAYLFDHPEYWYNPRENTTEQSWTASPVPGNKLADKPVYVLTSARTISGAEQFCYDLKMLKRATLVGETTGGAAHSGVWHRIDDHFGMGIPETKPINPFSKSDWAGTGVEPDVKVSAADALRTAEKLAARKLQIKQGRSGFPD
jgi:Peptidase family S41/N-terminal domain of Peptidase_S41 in eukaryotic IRBP